MAERIHVLKKNPFLDGPAGTLVKTIAERIAAVPQFRALFGDSIQSYKRMDYSLRQLPALRVYNNSYLKETESWWITGDVVLDVILPANLRRDDLEGIPDAISSALLQQFRRPPFFEEVEKEAPGLNELGKRFSVDKALGFEWQDGIVPLTQLTANFRIDLRQWDEYLEKTGRTKDDPFEVTLGDLKRMVGVIPGLNDREEEQVDVGIDQKPGGE